MALLRGASAVAAWNDAGRGLHAARRGMWRALLAGTALSAPLLIFGSQTLAATFTVTNTNDSGAGSLRQAMADANASAGADTIKFALGAPGQINLSSALPALVDVSGVTIDGSNQGSGAVTINGGGQNRIFFVYQGDTSISDLTLANGRAQGGAGGTGNKGGGGGMGAGGAIFVNGGTTSITNVLFTDNQAAGGSGGGSGGTAAGGGGGLGGSGGSASAGGGGGWRL
ncbi:MAG: hypothetical protein WDN48_18790 [Pseudolabrys sp.]